MKPNIGQNIVSSINFIMSSIPEDATELEKIRYIYINLGKLFCYDYRIIVDESVAYEPVDYNANEIGRYKTCYQISEILSVLINGMLPECKAKVIERKIPGRRFNKEHVGTEVTLSNGVKILLDLTLDLSNIQAGLKTKEFGYSNNANGDYDIISMQECIKMDKKLGFIYDKYTDDYIEEFTLKLSKENFTGMSLAETIDYKINKAKPIFFKDFKGNYEAVRYIYTLLSKVLSYDELKYLKQYNLSYDNSNDISLISIYSFNELGLYYSYSNDLGFNKINPKIIQELLKNGWKTNSMSIYNIFGDANEEDNKKIKA